MKNAGKLLGISLAGFLLLGSCSTVRENAEPNVSETTYISNDEQRKAIYERGGTYSPRHANPIPTAEQLGMNEQASEINRKKQIENRVETGGVRSGARTNEPANTPLQERPRQVENVGIDTVRTRPLPVVR